MFYPTGLVFYQVAQASLDCLVCDLAEWCCFQFGFSQLWDLLGFLCIYLIYLICFVFQGCSFFSSRFWLFGCFRLGI